MGKQVFTHRIAADLLAVVTHPAGRVAIAVLTDTDRTARVQNDVDLAIAANARDAVEALASRRSR